MVIKKLLIFDIDGTLADIDDLIIARQNNFIKEISFKNKIDLNDAKVLFFETKKKVESLGKYSTVDILLNLGFSKFDFFSMINRVGVNNRVIAMNDALDVLETLSNDFRIIALTNTPYLPAVNTLKKIGIFSAFEKVYCMDRDDFVKPSVDIFEKIFRDFNCRKGYSIGNSVDKDLVPAKEVGLKTVLLDVNGENKKCESIDFKIKSLRELLKIVK